MRIIKLYLISFALLYSCDFRNKDISHFPNGKIKEVKYSSKNNEECEVMRFDEQGDTIEIEKRIRAHRGYLKAESDTVYFRYTLEDSLGSHINEYFYSSKGRLVKDKESLFIWVEDRGDRYSLRYLGDDLQDMNIFLFDSTERIVDTLRLKRGESEFFLSKKLTRDNFVFVNLIIQDDGHAKCDSEGVFIYDVFFNPEIKIEFQKYFELSKFIN